MNSSLIQLLVLAAIAIFLILKLRSVLGTRDGFEKPPAQPAEAPSQRRREFDVIEGGGVDHDIVDHVPEGSDSARALTEMKRAEPSFGVSEFLGGARQAYEMILMAFERGDISEVRGFLAPEVAEGFDAAIAERKARGLTVEANFVGLKEMALQEATFEPSTRTGELTVRFLGELTTVMRNEAGEVVEGDARAVKRYRNVWTFARQMGSNDPNWQLVATGD